MQGRSNWGAFVLSIPVPVVAYGVGVGIFCPRC